jgi:hypothetical protein
MLLWRIRKFAQPGGQGLEKLDRKRVLKDATEHARIYLQKHPVVLGDEIREDLFRLAEAAESTDPNALLAAVQRLS